MNTCIHFFAALAVSSFALASCKPSPQAAAPAAPSPAANPSPAGGAEAPAPGPQNAEARKGNGPGGRGDFAQRAKERLEKMQADLALTAEQTAKLQPIFDRQVAAFQALRADESLDRKQVMEKMKESRQAVEAEIAAILTPEQNAKMAEWKAQRDAEMASRRPKRDKGPDETPKAP